MLVMLAKFRASPKFSDPGRLNDGVFVRLNTSSAESRTCLWPRTLNCRATPMSSCRSGGPVTWLRGPPSGLKSVCPIVATGAGLANAAGL